MSLLSADLSIYRSRVIKVATVMRGMNPVPTSPLESLEERLATYAGFAQNLQKEASEADLGKLFRQHKAVEDGYRACVKIGKRKEANVLLDKFSGWAYLKGAPSEPGDLHPLPAPDEK